MKTTTATTTNCSMADVKIKSHDVNTSGHRWANRKQFTNHNRVRTVFTRTE